MSKIAVVTGANKGIGFEIVKGLCATVPDWTVYLTCRNPELGQSAISTLGAPNCQFHQLDINDDASVSNLASFLKEKHGGIDVLINNAGMAFKGNAFDENVARTTIATNYFGTKRVCNALQPLMNPNSRFVVVSSMAGRLKQLSPELQARFTSPDLTTAAIDTLVEEFCVGVRDGNHKEKGWSNTTYGISKVAASALTRVIASGHNGPIAEGTIVAGMCPGWCRTDMAGDKAPRSAAQGAETAIWLATMPVEEAKKCHGNFCEDKKVTSW